MGVGPAERVVFNVTVEGLLRAMGEHADEPFLEQLAKLGIDARKKLQPAYPADAYIKGLELGVSRRWGHLPRDEAFAELGRAWIRGFEDTLTGRALLAMIRVLGPRRTILRMTRNFRTANNYTECAGRELAPTHFEIVCRPVVNPGYYRGILEEGLGYAGGKGVRVRLASRAGDECVFDVTWDA